MTMNGALLIVLLVSAVEKQCGGELTVGHKAPPVKISVYYESLCPYSIRFINTQLWPTFSRLKDIMDITLIPHGNAKERPGVSFWEFLCQHGAPECMGNVIESCA